MYGIIGLGRFGKALALQLAESGKEILVLDADETAYARYASTRKMRLS